jgi:hypothetical protein
MRRNPNRPASICRKAPVKSRSRKVDTSSGDGWANKAEEHRFLQCGGGVGFKLRRKLFLRAAWELQAGAGWCHLTWLCRWVGQRG